MSKMKQCKACSKEIATNAKSCPGCGAKNKKPVYKRVWFWVVAAIVVIGVAGGSDNSNETNHGNIESVQEVSQSSSENTVPTEYKSALKQAETYGKRMHMSKAAVYDQLTSEFGGQFSPEAAQYAVDNVKADWNQIIWELNNETNGNYLNMLRYQKFKNKNILKAILTYNPEFKKYIIN